MKLLLMLGQTVFEWTWKNSISAALLVTLVFAAQKVLGRWLTPRLRYALSLLILIRLLFPMVPSSSLSLENLFRLRASPKGAVLPPAALRSWHDDAIAARLGGISRGVSPGISQPPAASAPVLSARAWTGVVWIAGFFCLMTLAIWRYRKWNCLVAEGQPVSDPHLLELLESARTDMGVRRPVKLVVVERLSSPAAFGFWRACLILPESAASQLSVEELRMVFLHEMAHIRQHDVSLNWLLIFVQFLHWFNPLVWLANHRIRADRELVRDAMAMSCLPASERQHYGQVLIKLMDGFSMETPVFAGAVPVIGSKQEIKRRLIMIKHHRHRSLGAVLATALVVAALACTTFTRAQQSAENASGWVNWNNGQKIGSFFAVAGTPRETVAVGIDGLIATRNNATGVWTTQTFIGDPIFAQLYM